MCFFNDLQGLRQNARKSAALYRGNALAFKVFSLPPKANPLALR